jgi:hypothetical protein
VSEATVYRLDWDVERFQSYVYDLPDPELDLWLFDGTPRLSNWKPLPVYSDYPRLESPDIWHLVGAAVLVISTDVIDLLEPFISRAGELLPLVVSGTGEEVFALNVLEDIDCVSPGGYSDDDLNLSFDFLEHRLPESGLFKIPQCDTVLIFYVERDDDVDNLRQRVAHHGLSGVSFEPVWSSTSGARPINLFPA